MAQDLPEVADLIGDNVTEGDFKTAITKMLLFMRDGGGMPSGGIIMWSGSASDVPDGWALCDGNNGTPNLTGRFIIGAGGTYSIGETGGSSSGVTGAASGNTGAASGNTGATTISTSTMPSHGHNLSTSIYAVSSGGIRTSPFEKGSSVPSAKAISASSTGSGSSHTHTLNSHTHTLNSHTHTVGMPPYYALCYIMKI